MLAQVIANIIRERRAVRRRDLASLVDRHVADMWIAGHDRAVIRAVVGTAAVEAEVSGLIHRIGEWWATGPAPRM
jgi:hypothetical protein